MVRGPRSVIRVTLCAGFLLALWSAVGAAQGALYALPTDRFGVGLKPDLGAITDYDVASLRIGWYCDWRTRLSPERPGGIEYAQLVWIDQGRFSPGLNELGRIIAHNPGSLWLIGNEPECIWQGNSTPQQYATAYHDLYVFIKERDATAKVAVGGVVQPSPLRLEWLDHVLDHYQTTYGHAMPVDVWNTHVQILQELQGDWGCQIPRGLTQTSGRLYRIEDNGSIDIFRQLILEFRTWMRDRGQRAKPLIISEYGVLFPPEYGYTPERVNAFMNASFDYLLSARDADLGCPDDQYRLVQRWLWYSLNDQPWDAETGKGFNGALFERQDAQHPAVITPVGINFRNYMRALASSQELAQDSQTSMPTVGLTATSEPTDAARTAAAGAMATRAPTATPMVVQTGSLTAAALPTATVMAIPLPTATPLPSAGASRSRAEDLLRGLVEWLHKLYAYFARLLTR